MKKEPLETLFKELQGSFDTEEPESGHRQRFLEKLQAGQSKNQALRFRSGNWWKTLGIAASLALLCMLGIRLFAPAPSLDEQVASISPEISKTNLYFTSLIEEQVRELESESSPETKKLIDDTLLQMKKLETNYQKLEQDLLRGGNSKMILSAMITNFQTRIDLLQDVMAKIDTIKTYKSQDDENYTI